MAAKILESLADDRKQQVGCMTGFIHLFEPNHQPLKRITNFHGRITSPQGDSQYCPGSCEVEQTTNPYHQHGLEMRSNRNSNDRLGMYAESSRASCSSSHSSFSSLDYSKVVQNEPSSYDRIIFPESPLLDRSLSHSSSSWRMRQRSFDLNDSVKDLSCTTESVEESVLLKHQDSPRPLQPLKLSVESQNVSSEQNGAPRVPFKDALHFYNEDKSSRLLYESKDTQHDRTDIKCYKHEAIESQKLDMSECSMQRSHQIQRPPSIVEKLMGLDAMPRVNSMTQNRFVQIGERQDTNLISKSTSPATQFKPIQLSSVQRCLRKDQAVERWRNSELVMKPICSSRILMEPAPWKQPDVNGTLPKSAVKNKQGSAYVSNGFPPVYDKFERRLNDMEFQRSSKDLKVLKQMLDAVQQNGLRQLEKEVSSNGATRNYNPDSHYLAKAPKIFQQKNVCTSVANGEQERCVKSMNSPIVLMKPFRLVAKSDIVASSVARSEGMGYLSKPHAHGSDSGNRKKTVSNIQMVKGQTPRNGCQVPRMSPSEKKPTRSLPNMPQQVLKVKKTNSAVSAGTGNPKRLQQKKFELEKKPRPATPSHDAAKMGKPNSKHSRNSCSSGEKSRLKSTVQQCDAQSSDFSIDSKDTSSYCGDDTEVTSKLRLDHTDGGRSPARKVARPMFSAIRKQKPSHISISSEDASRRHPAAISPEQPSPVSVLDSSAYRSSTPSPLKKMASCGTDRVTGMYSDNRLSTNATGLTTNMSREKLKHIDDLVNKLKGVSSTYDDESNKEFISPLCETTNPDQPYISKILLASGFLLRDFESTGNTFQPHISGHPINPELFSVLEQTQTGALPIGDLKRSSAAKSRRRLIFDCINETLAELLVPMGMSNNSRCIHKKLARKTVNARQLLKDLCDRTEEMQGKSNQGCENQLQSDEEQVEERGLKTLLFDDLRSDKWGNSNRVMHEVVLDIERMLFKDLVKEIVCDEAVLVSLQSKAKTKRSCDKKLLFQ